MTHPHVNPRKLLLAATAILATGLTAACQPVPGLNAVTGDSITAMAGTQPFISSTEVMAYPGKTASAAVPWVHGIVNDPTRSPSCIVEEFGNEPGDGTITQAERDAMFELVFIPDPATRVVLVKPWRLHPSASVQAAIVQWRGVLDTLHAARPGSVVIDIKDIADAYPEDFADDGVHENALGAVMLDGMYRSACEGAG